MAEVEKRVAGFNVSDGTNTLANITSYDINVSVSEEEVSGLGDTVGSVPIISEKYMAVSVGKTASLAGVVYTGEGSSGTGPTDASLEAFIDKAETGGEMTLEYRYDDASGYDLTGFFTEFSLTGDKGEATEKYTGNFRVNTKTDVTL